MRRKICCVVLVFVLPLLLEATNGCSLDQEGIGCDSDDCMKPPPESNTNSYVCSCSCTPEKRQVQALVTASEDDAEQTTVQIILDSPVLHLAEGQVEGVRFRHVNIPQGAHVLAAYVQFTASDDDNLVLNFSIQGEDADNGAPFALVANSVTGRTFVPTAVSWGPGAWTANASGLSQQTSDLSDIVQAIVDRPGWVADNAMVFVISHSGGNGERRAFSQDGKPSSAPLLFIEYEDLSLPMVGPQNLPMCVLPADNPNIGGSAADPAVDCAGRVQKTLSGMLEFCGYPSQCMCSVQPGSQRFSDTCDQPCVEDPVDPDCADFDPISGMVTATNAAGDVPICGTNSPLAFEIFGRRTMCTVSGVAHVAIEGETADPTATGVLQFRGDPCPGQSCRVGMEYRLDIAPVRFSNLFGSETFEELAGIGESVVGQDAVLSASGDGSFAAGVCLLSARGVREGEQRALAVTNSEPININVSFGSVDPTCALSGAVVGISDPEIKRCEAGRNICSSDSDCGDDDECSEVGDSQLLLSLDVGGKIVNQPPTADAGTDQVVECPAPVVLDARASSDLDSNIALFSWRRGTRTGEEVGFDEVSSVQQGLGTESYVLRVIDAFAQTDEDTTTATVVDTTPPELSCSVAVPVLHQTNHTMLNVGLASRARDACDGELAVTVSVFGDEDDEMQSGDGNFAPDAKSIAVGSLRLRAERQGNGDGRVYLILVEATDSSANRGINCCTVVVPHSNKQQALQSVQAQAAAAQAFCLAHAGMPPAGYFVLGDAPLIGPKQ